MKLSAFGLVLVFGVASIGACSSSGSSGGGTGGAAGGGGSGATGTGGGSAGSGGSAGNSGAFCEQICTKVSGVGCANEIKADCVTDCTAQYSTCKSEFTTLASCVESTASLSCDTDGDLVIDGCDSSLRPFAACIACLPEVDDDACNTCQKGNCCAQSKAVLNASDVLSLIACFEACPPNDSPCQQGCLAANPNAAAAFPALNTCLTNNCSAECS